MVKPELSVVIPVLNEAALLPGLLKSLQKQQGVVVEIIIGDGGSDDDSRQIIDRLGAFFVQTEKGRGKQMNAAAAKAAGEFLLFLHADSTINDPHLLANALSYLRGEMARQNRSDIAGHFCLQFVRNSKKNTFAYRYLEEKTYLNRVNTTNGDQGFLLSREFFQKLGGFNTSLPFLEDQELAERIRHQGIWVTLPGQIQTSARRFEAEGFHRRYILMSMIMGCYSVGMKTFFNKTPKIYNAQYEAKSLRLYSFLAIVWEIMVRDLGFWRSVRFWYELGRYIRPNAWQLFFVMDVLLINILGRRKYRFLKFYDKFVGPLLDFAVFNAVTGIFSFIWFMLILTPYFWMQEKIANDLLK